MSSKKAAYENPLIPHARLKQMYRAILRAYLLGEALPSQQRALMGGCEAALVSSSLDLTGRDFVFDAFENPVIDFLRRAMPGDAHKSKSSRPRRVGAENGSATRLLAPTDPAARLWSGVGAAVAIQSLAAQSTTSVSDSPVVMVYALPGDVPADTWKSVLSFTGQRDLPIIFVVLPDPSVRKRSARPDLRTIAHRAHVPAMPVDADDSVALYRVAQESIGHARIGGGPALIECASFAANARQSTSHPGLAHLEEYILSRRIAARAWMDREASSFASQIRNLKSASK